MCSKCQCEKETPQIVVVLLYRTYLKNALLTLSFLSVSPPESVKSTKFDYIHGYNRKVCNLHRRGKKSHYFLQGEKKK